MASILRKATHTACGTLCTAMRQSASGGRPWLQAPLIIEMNTPMTAAPWLHNSFITEASTPQAAAQTAQDVHLDTQGGAVNVSRAAQILPTVPEQQSSSQAMQETHGNIESTAPAKQPVASGPIASQLQSTNRGIAGSFGTSSATPSEPIQENSRDQMQHQHGLSCDIRSGIVPNPTQ